MLAAVPFEQEVLVVGGLFAFVGSLVALIGLLRLPESPALTNISVVALAFAAVCGYYATAYGIGVPFYGMGLVILTAAVLLVALRSFLRGGPAHREDAPENERQRGDHEGDEGPADPGVRSGEIAEHPETVGARTRVPEPAGTEASSSARGWPWSAAVGGAVGALLTLALTRRRR